MVQSLPSRNGGLHVDIRDRLAGNQTSSHDCEVQTGIHDLRMQEVWRGKYGRAGSVGDKEKQEQNAMAKLLEDLAQEVD